MESLEERKTMIRVKRAVSIGQAVADAKAGFRFDHCFDNFDQSLRFAGLTLEDLELTQEDVERFAHAHLVELAKEALEDDIDRSPWGMSLVKRLIKQRQVTFAEIGTTPMQLQYLWRQEGIHNATKALEKCRRGEFEYYGNDEELHMNHLLYGLEEYSLRLEDIGTDEQEIELFKRPAAMALCKHLIAWMDEERQRDDSYYRWQDAAWTIFRFMKLYGLAAADLEISEDQLSCIAQETGLEFIKSWAQFVTYGDGRLSELDAIVRFAGRERIPLSDEELQVLQRAEEILLKAGELLGIE